MLSFFPKESTQITTKNTSIYHGINNPEERVSVWLSV